MSAKDVAKLIISDFAARTYSPGAWPFLSRAEVAAGALDRIDHPDDIDQADTNLCGPASLVRSLVIDNPVEYALAIKQLFEDGMATIHTRTGLWRIKPDDCLLLNKLPATDTPKVIDQADWIIMASIRNSHDWYIKYCSVNGTASGITTSKNLARMFRQAGYREVRNGTRLDGLGGMGIDNVREASDLYEKGYKVCLLINDNMLYASADSDHGSQSDDSHFPNHWVMLTSKILLTPCGWTEPEVAFQSALRNALQQKNPQIQLKNSPASSPKAPSYDAPRNHHCGLLSTWISFTVYTWGDGHQHVPIDGSMPLSVSDFEKNYYGYVACKY